jgi:hypothetical protein
MAMKMIANHGTEEIPSSESTGEEELESVRRIDGCINCGEEREIAAHGLCFKCYRKKERDDDRKFAGVDRHNPGLNKEHTKLLRGFTQVMVGLSDLGVSEADVLSVRRILEPYLVLVANFLALASERCRATLKRLGRSYEP